MPLPLVREADVEPLDRVVTLNVSARQLEQLDLAVRELGISRAWLIRECIAEGFASVVQQVRERRRAGLVPRGEYQNPSAVAPRRGPRSDGLRADRWVSAPVRRPRDR